MFVYYAMLDSMCSLTEIPLLLVHINHYWGWQHRRGSECVAKYISDPWTTVWAAEWPLRIQKMAISAMVFTSRILNHKNVMTGEDSMSHIAVKGGSSDQTDLICWMDYRGEYSSTPVLCFSVCQLRSLWPSQLLKRIKHNLYERNQGSYMVC